MTKKEDMISRIATVRHMINDVNSVIEKMKRTERENVDRGRDASEGARGEWGGGSREAYELWGWGQKRN